MVKPSRRREMAQRAVTEWGLSIRSACQAFQIIQSCYRYEAKQHAENEEIAGWLLRLTDNNRSWGFATCTCATSKDSLGITSGCTGFTGNWN